MDRGRSLPVLCSSPYRWPCAADVTICGWCDVKIGKLANLHMSAGKTWWYLDVAGEVHLSLREILIYIYMCVFWNVWMNVANVCTSYIWFLSPHVQTDFIQQTLDHFSLTRTSLKCLDCWSLTHLATNLSGECRISHVQFFKNLIGFCCCW